jgi:pimeloyl-ACP methyl ester carboxylesterase
VCLCLEEQYSLQRGSEDSNGKAKPGPRSWSQATKRAFSFLRPLWVKAIVPTLFTVFSPLVIIGLRMKVRDKDFWEKGLSRAHQHPETVTPELLYRYRLPALVHGWEQGLLRFVRASMVSYNNEQTSVVRTAVAAGVHDDPPSATEDGSGSGAQSGRSDKRPVEGSLLQRFKQKLEATRVPVVIVHGEQDCLVPIGNSSRLSAALGAPLVKLSDCGHTPAEEVPQVFVEVLTRFVRQVKGESASHIKRASVAA